MNPLALCDFDPGHFLVLGPNVGPLQYYSHLPIIVLSLILAFFILFQNPRALANRILFATISTYILWVFFDSVIWASNRSDVIMFMWSLQVLIEPLVYVGCLYLLYVLIGKKDASLGTKLIWFVLYLPLILAAPTYLNLSGFDTGACLAVEGLVAHYYSYTLEGILVLWITSYVVRNMRAVPSDVKRERGYLLAGVLLLLMAFSWGNLIGSFSDNWQLGQFGLFGMPIFAGFLAYSIVRFNTFNAKLIGAVGLVFGLGALTFSLLFVENVSVFRPVALVTFLLTLVFGSMLIRSVTREVRQRQLIEKQEKELESANRQQESLLHFISHEVKGYLTKNEAAFDAIRAGDYGDVTPQLHEMSASALADTRKGVATVIDILDASNLKNGTVSYNKKLFDLVHAVDEIVTDLSITAREKNLELIFHKPVTGAYSVIGDEDKLRRHVLRNIIDNSIKYTPNGSITVDMARTPQVCRVTVTDTGVGITPEDMAKLFTEGGHGAESIKVNVHSTGYGLYIAKQVVEAHGGKVWAESGGAGKGSRFIIELPVQN